MSIFLRFQCVQTRIGLLQGCVHIVGYPPKPGHFVSSITYRQGLMALPGQGQCIDLR